VVSTELPSPEVDLDLQRKEKNDDQITKNMEQEIGCPRCSIIMMLYSHFDRLLYSCYECHLSLVINSLIGLTFYQSIFVIVYS
jgi:ribosomal protein S27AE